MSRQAEVRGTKQARHRDTIAVHAPESTEAYTVRFPAGRHILIHRIPGAGLDQNADRIRFTITEHSCDRTRPRVRVDATLPHALVSADNGARPVTGHQSSREPTC